MRRLILSGLAGVILAAGTFAGAGPAAATTPRCPQRIPCHHPAPHRLPAGGVLVPPPSHGPVLR